jgi:hypothetical protein
MRGVIAGQVAGVQQRVLLLHSKSSSKARQRLRRSGPSHWASFLFGDGDEGYGGAAQDKTPVLTLASLKFNSSTQTQSTAARGRT